MEETEEPTENPITTIPVAAVMMLNELLFELQDSDRALGERLIARFKKLEDGVMAKANPGSMELIRLITMEMEARNHGK